MVFLSTFAADRGASPAQITVRWWLVSKCGLLTASAVPSKTDFSQV